MSESCELYIVKDGDPNNLDEKNISLLGTVTVLSDSQISKGQKLRMSIVHEEELDEGIDLKIVLINDAGARKKLILCR